MKRAALKTAFAVGAVILSLMQPTFAANDKPPVITDLAWLAGEWRGEKWDGLLEEHWSQPADNTMICMFRHTKQGKPVFYEFITIEKSEHGLAMYLRHFNARLVGWEDKDNPLVFTLRSSSAKEVVFERVDAAKALRVRITYKLEAPERLTAILEREKDGQTSTEVFNYKRAVKVG